MEIRVLLRGFNESLCRVHGIQQKVNAIAVTISSVWQKERSRPHGFRKESHICFRFWPRCAAREILVLQSGVEPIPPALEAWSLSHRGLPGKSPKFTFVNSRHPTIFFLRLCHFAGVFKNLLRLFCWYKVGTAHSVPVLGDSWAAWGKDNPKLTSDRASRKLSDQVTRHGEETHTCLNVKSPGDKYIWVYAITFFS